MLRIKETRWSEFCENAEQLGFVKNRVFFSNYEKVIKSGCAIITVWVNEITRNFDDFSRDVKKPIVHVPDERIEQYIQDLIEQGYVEKVAE